MPALAKTEFQYIAHMQGDNGQTVEIAGTAWEWSTNHVYNLLMDKAFERDAWLIAHSITEVGEEAPFVPDRPLPKIVSEKPPPTFGVDVHFEEWKPTFKAASLCTYKETR